MEELDHDEGLWWPPIDVEVGVRGLPEALPDHADENEHRPAAVRAVLPSFVHILPLFPSMPVVLLLLGCCSHFRTVD